jgi:ribose-phosphate pyrophosphokinase
MDRVKLFAGNANLKLAQEISDHLNIPLSATVVGRFSDEEVRVEIQENVRGNNAFIIQPTCAPANDTLMELMLIADSLYRSSTKKITAIVPYLGYSRQDRRPGTSRSPISARVVADMLQSVNIDHLVTIDLHAIQIQGFYKIPVDNLSTGGLFAADIQQRYLHNNPILVSPDIGGVGRARATAKQLGTDLAIIDKRRPNPGISEVMNIIGDVKGRACIITDDIVDSAGTLCKAADALTLKGASRVIAYCTHAVLSGTAIETINSSSLHELVITDTIPYDSNNNSKIRVISVANMLAEAIKRLSCGDSLSELST